MDGWMEPMKLVLVEAKHALLVLFFIFIFQYCICSFSILRKSKSTPCVGLASATNRQTQDKKSRGGDASTDARLDAHESACC